MPMKLISNRVLRELTQRHPEADGPLQAWRRLVERSEFSGFAALRATFASVDKVGERYVFNIGGNKYRLITSIAFAPRIVWVKAVLTHAEYDKEKWK